MGKVTFALELRFCAFRHTHTFYYCTFWKRIREERKCAVFCPHFTAVAQGLKFASGVVSLGPKNIFCSRLPSLRKWSLGCSKKTVLTYIIFCTHLWIGSGTVFANHAKKSTYPWNYCPSDFEAKKSWDDCLTWNKIENCQNYKFNFMEKCLEESVKTTTLIHVKCLKIRPNYTFNVAEKSVKITLIHEKMSVKSVKLQLWFWVNMTEKSVKITPLNFTKKCRKNPKNYNYDYE